jgi:hypothetical protein
MACRPDGEILGVKKDVICATAIVGSGPGHAGFRATEGEKRHP